jgi:hypothetical protein
VPEGLFAPPPAGTDERACFLPLPPPTDEEVHALPRAVRHRVVRLLERLGKLAEDSYPENALEALLAASLQRRLPFPGTPTSPQAPRIDSKSHEKSSSHRHPPLK